jgi:hypothetical protein
MIRRKIGIAYLDAVADLLTRGFSQGSRGYWMNRLLRQSVHEVPERFPCFGHMLDHEETPVGVLAHRKPVIRNSSVQSVCTHLHERSRKIPAPASSSSN